MSTQKSTGEVQKVDNICRLGICCYHYSWFRCSVYISNRLIRRVLSVCLLHYNKKIVSYIGPVATGQCIGPNTYVVQIHNIIADCSSKEKLDQNNLTHPVTVHHNDNSYVCNIILILACNLVKSKIYICALVCEKGSYSLFNCMYLTTYNLTCECGISLKFSPLIPLT